MITIIFSHPNHNSKNGKIFHSILKHCTASGKDFTAIDLYGENFSPLLTAEELDGFYIGKATDPLVLKYQDILMRTDSLIFLFPIWFNEYPAIFKGFYDRVCMGNFAFGYAPNGVFPKLTHIKRALVVTTSHAPTQVLRTVQGDMIERQVIGHMLKTIGVSESKWLNLDGTPKVDEQQLDVFTSSIKAEIDSFLR